MGGGERVRLLMAFLGGLESGGTAARVAVGLEAARTCVMLLWVAAGRGETLCVVSSLPRPS